jgi:hypothetical protein
VATGAAVTVLAPGGVRAAAVLLVAVTPVALAAPVVDRPSASVPESLRRGRPAHATGEELCRPAVSRLVPRLAATATALAGLAPTPKAAIGLATGRRSRRSRGIEGGAAAAGLARQREQR